MNQNKSKWESQHMQKKCKNKRSVQSKRRHNRLKRHKLSLRKQKRFQSQQSIDDDNNIYYRLRRSKANVKIREIGFAHYDGDISNRDFKFYHPLQYLWSLKQDYLLGKKIYIKYWNDENALFEGILTCISHSGQYKVSQIKYCGNKTYAENHLNLYTDSYWFHMCCTKEVYIIKDEQKTDIHMLLMDIMKLKMINYFLFICAFQLKDKNDVFDPAIKYLMERYIINADDKILRVNRCLFKSCEFTKEMVAKFVYGKKQNMFEYLTKKDWRKKKVYLHSDDLLDIICSYHESVVEYMKEQKENQTENMQDNDNDNDDQKKELEAETQETETKEKDRYSYMDWDRREITQLISYNH